MNESLYFLAIIPPQPIHDEVKAFKHEVLERFDSKAALRSPPHITLHMPFKWKDKKEDLLVQKLAEFQFGAYPFELELKGFDSFPPKVIFVDVVKNESLILLQKELIKHVRKELNVLNADYKDKPFHSHITIAFRDLKKNRFQEAFEYFSTQEYKATFKISGFHLLRHDGKRWNEFRFFENGEFFVN